MKKEFFHRLVPVPLSLVFALAAPAQPSDPLHQLDQSLETLTRRVAPAVVKILVTTFGPLEEGGHPGTSLVARQHSIGSGVVVDASGYIITNAHVVEGAQRVRVQLAPPPGAYTSPLDSLNAAARVLDARIIGVSRQVDLALLKVDASGLPILALNHYSDIRQGQLVFAFGSPKGLENSVTMGLVSSVARQLDPDSPMVYIQTDAAINPGNSGGPLVDVDGRLAGVNTFIYSQSGGNEGIGFAIPSATVRFVYGELRKHGHVHRGRIGAGLQTITPLLAKGLRLPRETGIIVSDVIPGGPADGAGLKPGDIVLALDGRPAPSLPAFQAALMFHGEGGRVKLDVLRGDAERLTIETPVIQRPHSFDRLADSIDPEKSRVPALGILGVEITRDLASKLDGLRAAAGVIVVARTAGPAGGETGLEAGDVIHALNGMPIVTLAGLRQALSELHSGDAAALRIERQGQLFYIAFEIE